MTPLRFVLSLIVALAFFNPAHAILTGQEDQWAKKARGGQNSRRGQGVRTDRRITHDDRQTRRMMRTHQELGFTLHSNAEGMHGGAKQECVQLMLQAMDIAEGAATPVQPIVVSASLGNGLSFSFETYGDGIREVLGRATSNLRGFNGVSRTDSASVTVNGITRRASTDGWWNNARQQAQIVTALAVDASYDSGLPVSTKKYAVHGFAGTNGILAEGNSLRELKESCLRLTSVHQRCDELVVSINGRAPARRSTRNWWNNKQELCQVAIDAAWGSKRQGPLGL